MIAVYCLIGYLLLLNAYAFVLMGIDKRRAARRDNRRRIPEKRLFGTAFLGGSAGILAGMKVWRHKTQHRSFAVGIPYLVAVHLIIVIVLGWLLAQRLAS